VGLLEIVVLKGRMDQKDQLVIKALKGNLAKMERLAKGSPVRRVLLDPQGQWALKDQLDNPPRMDHRDRKVLQDRSATQVNMVLLGQLGHQAQPVDLDLRRNCVLAVLEAEQMVEEQEDQVLKMEVQVTGKGMTGKVKERKRKRNLEKTELEDQVETTLRNKLTISIIIYHVYHCKCYD